MRRIPPFLFSLAWFHCGVLGAEVIPFVQVSGDVPMPRTVRTDRVDLTIHAALLRAGLDLTPYYAAPGDGKKCPIRIVRIRDGAPVSYDPAADEEKLRNENLQPTDVIAITDFRKHPGKMGEREMRIRQMLDLGSTEIGGEIRALATLRHEYDAWAGWQPGREPGDPDAFLKREVDRLVDDGHGEKIIRLLELRRGTLVLEGLGLAHPSVRDVDELLWMLMQSHGPVIER